jgi:hypothetical protein
VERALHLIDELRDIVQGKPRFEITEIAGRYLEGPSLGSARRLSSPRRSVSLTISRKGRPARCTSVLSFAATSSSRVKVVRTH